MCHYDIDMFLNYLNPKLQHHQSHYIYKQHYHNLQQSQHNLDYLNIQCHQYQYQCFLHICPLDQFVLLVYHYNKDKLMHYYTERLQYHQNHLIFENNYRHHLLFQHFHYYLNIQYHQNNQLNFLHKYHQRLYKVQIRYRNRGMFCYYLHQKLHYHKQD